MNEKIDNLMKESIDVQWEIMYKLKTLIEASWDSDTLKIKLESLLKDFDKLNEELNEVESKE